ncbi:ribulose-phosphate 3-epimerase [Ornithobacterium rhinotracheale]|uniref:ribulose-phosphate 3-epimerase n=1 Tax=Ornithobacterium rhinotracheale TaxID=28251 RepID=UPI00129C99EB|nr:ribulose-phosphate 3-epimerase [Ornithobacterium rhinotracheale]MRJ11189.1 ribulose-phosphate 3-epimerase [Ornithobacterium rhinotracheale]
MAIVAPSMLAADFLHLDKDIQMVNESPAEWFHLDIMDGVFVPNISYGMPVIEAIRKATDKFLDVHLMITQPERYTQTFKACGADLLSVHYEACPHLHRNIQQIKSEGMQAGVALNPHTPVHLLGDIIQDLDLVLIMSVNPGFGGQKFIENTYKKVAEAKNLILQKNASALIEVDGGIDINNAAKLTECGADVLVAGSAVFKAENPLVIIEKLQNA